MCPSTTLQCVRLKEYGKQGKDSNGNYFLSSPLGGGNSGKKGQIKEKKRKHYEKKREKKEGKERKSEQNNWPVMITNRESIFL